MSSGDRGVDSLIRKGIRREQEREESRISSIETTRQGILVDIKSRMGDYQSFFDTTMNSFLVQEEAVKEILPMVYAHYASRINQGLPSLTARVITCGPSGSGKSYLFETLGEHLKVPVQHFWASDFLGSGKITQIEKQNQSQERARYGIVIIKGFDNETFSERETREICQNLYTSFYTALKDSVVSFEFTYEDLFQRKSEIEEHIVVDARTSASKSSESIAEQKEQIEKVIGEKFRSYVLQEIEGYVFFERPTETEFYRIIDDSQISRQMMAILTETEAGNFLPKNLREEVVMAALQTNQGFRGLREVFQDYYLDALKKSIGADDIGYR